MSSNASSPSCWMLSTRVALRELVWYVPMMRPKSLPADPSTDVTVGTPSEPRRRLSVVHAGALYRPVPPVEFDDDGYIYRDGKVPESTGHGASLAYGFYAAQSLLAHLPDALVAYDLALLFEQDNPRAVVAPDLMVAIGAGRHHRNSYKLWEEPTVPDFALEVLSEKTWRKDVEVKPGLYRDLGVREFWLVDPLGKLPDPITGWHLNDARLYERIPTLPSGGRRSDVLGAELFHDDQGLRFRDLKTGEVLPTYLESQRLRERELVARKAAEARARREAAAREAAEKRIAELEQRLQRSEGPSGESLETRRKER